MKKPKVKKKHSSNKRRYLHQGISFFVLTERTDAMAKYIYKGPVMEFGRCVADHWEGETVAPSVGKARSNLAYQFKKFNNRSPSAKIALPGKFQRMDY